MQARNISRLDLLKIDVEGAELAVLRGIDARDWVKIKQVCSQVPLFSHNLEQQVCCQKSLVCNLPSYCNKVDFYLSTQTWISALTLFFMHTHAIYKRTLDTCGRACNTLASI